MSENLQFDVFRTHSAKDRATVRPFPERVRQDGRKVWFGEWESKPRSKKPTCEKKSEEGLEHAGVLVICRAANAFGLDWEQMEAGTFRIRDPLNKDRRSIPLRIHDRQPKAPWRSSITSTCALRSVIRNTSSSSMPAVFPLTPPPSLPTPRDGVRDLWRCSWGASARA
jgi:hypothetical protein